MTALTEPTDLIQPFARRRGLPVSIMVPPAALIWVATAAVIAGFGLLAYTWAKVSTLTIVAAQIPYLVSSGLTGLGLITVGSALLVVWSRRTDDVERRRQTDELITALREIRAGMDEDPA